MQRLREINRNTYRHKTRDKEKQRLQEGMIDRDLDERQKEKETQR